MAKKAVGPNVSLLRPVSKQFIITAPFGHNTGVHKDAPHKGTDFGCPIGTPCYAALDGIVQFARVEAIPDDPAHPENGPAKAGNRIWLYCELPNNQAVRLGYFHLSKFEALPGHKVKAGEVIAYSGNTGHSTGPHLHFEVRMLPADVPIKPTFTTSLPGDVIDDASS